MQFPLKTEWTDDMKIKRKLSFKIKLSFIEKLGFRIIKSQKLWHKESERALHTYRLLISVIEFFRVSKADFSSLTTIFSSHLSLS